MRPILLCVLIIWNVTRAQNFTFTVHTQPQKCRGGTADLEIGGTGSDDHLSIQWSTGQNNLSSISGLNEGDYHANITITSPGDSLPVITDTTIFFSITKEICPVGVPLHFSPNDDGYNDELRLSYIELYPNFELQIFNRWGQMVHKQKKNYTPWTGKWAGIDVPDGTYYYVLIYDTSNRQLLQKGDITILR